jgi:hypothetical protein
MVQGGGEGGGPRRAKVAQEETYALPVLPRAAAMVTFYGPPATEKGVRMGSLVTPG